MKNYTLEAVGQVWHVTEPGISCLYPATSLGQIEKDKYCEEDKGIVLPQFKRSDSSWK